jgi:membrane protease YdiL (CAAX protease family)
MRSWTRDHPLTVFLLLAFPLSWYPWILALLRGTTTGPNPLGPFVAALIVTAMVSGRTGIRDLLGKLVLWRVRPRYYLVALGLPILISVLAAAFTVAAGDGTLKPAPISWSDLVESFLFILLFIGLGEEPGWRGFALPELQRRHSPAVATLILSAVWAVWHLPLIGSEFPMATVPPFLASLLGGAFLQTWLFNRTRGSLLLQMLCHAMVNTIGAGLAFRWFAGSDLLILRWSTAVLWLAAGAASVVLSSRSTSRHARESVEAAGA